MSAGHVRRNWKKRFFALKDERLTKSIVYYEGDQNGVGSGT